MSDESPSGEAGEHIGREAKRRSEQGLPYAIYLSIVGCMAKPIGSHAAPGEFYLSVERARAAKSC